MKKLTFKTKFGSHQQFDGILTMRKLNRKFYQFDFFLLSNFI